MVCYGRVLKSMVLKSIVGSGLVWYGMEWYGMVWYGMVWYGMVWYGMVWYVQPGMVCARRPTNIYAVYRGEGAQGNIQRYPHPPLAFCYETILVI